MTTPPDWRTLELDEGIGDGIDRGREGGFAGSLGRDIPRMAPYYMIMRLPGAATPEFLLMSPMVPSQRMC